MRNFNKVYLRPAFLSLCDILIKLTLMNLGTLQPLLFVFLYPNYHQEQVSNQAWLSEHKLKWVFHLSLGQLHVKPYNVSLVK